MTDFLVLNTTTIVARVRELLQSNISAKCAIAKTAAEFGISVDAVRGRYNRAGGNLEKAHGHMLLNEAQDRTLCLLILSFSAANMPVDGALVKQIVGKLWNVHPAHTWPSRWMRTHNDEISARKTKALTSRRAAKVIVAEVENFILAVDMHREKVPMRARNVLNYDETIIKVAADGHYVFENRYKQRCQSIGCTRTTLGTLLPIVSAAGQVLCSFWVLKGAEDCVQQVVLPDGLPSAWPRFWVWTATGYMNSEAFAVCLEKFLEVWTAQHPGQTAWLIGDNLGVHRQIDLIKRALELNVEFWFLPANSSHFLQPLDAAPFAKLKKYFVKETYSAMFKAKLLGSPEMQTLATLAFEAELYALTPNAIKSGFSDSGIFPWKPDLIEELVEANVCGAGQCVDDDKAVLVEAAAEVITAFRNDAADRANKTRKVAMRIQRDRLFNPADIVEQAELLAKEKEAKVREQMRIEVSQTCQHILCDSDRRGKRKWHECEHCLFVVCPAHKTDLALHMAGCSCK